MDTARPPPRSGLRGLAAAVGAGLLAIIVFGYASQPREVAAPPTTQAVVAEPEPVVTTIPQASTTTTIDQIIDGPLLEFLPEATGSVMTAVAGTSDSHLLTLPSGATATRTELPVGTGPVLFFDAADRQMAFLGSSLRLSGLTLYVGGLQGWVPLTGRVTSFAWHSTWPGRLAWVETGEGLCVADIDTDGSTVAAPRCLPRVSGRLTGFDDHGFLVVADEDVVRLDSDGRVVSRMTGSNALVAPDGRVLVETDHDPGGNPGSYTLTGPMLTDHRVLDWAPSQQIAAFGMVAWSPQATIQRTPDANLSFPQLAFLVDVGPGNYQIQRWDLDGNQIDAIFVDGRFWDIGWDRSGQYLLAPGRLDIDDVVFVYDLYSRQPTLIPFGAQVRESRLVVPAECEDASYLTRDWEFRYSGRFEDFWMVPSRDSHLGLLSGVENPGWWVLSARVSAGSLSGEIATWMLPFHNPSGESHPSMSFPANAVARDLGVQTQLNPEDYGLSDEDDWMLVDGARISQWCVTEASR